MVRRILVALDGSDTSERALREAIRLAQAPRARLRLVHVVDEFAAKAAPAASLDAFWKAARAAGRSLLDEAAARARKAGVEPETRLLEIRTLGSLVRRVPSLIVDEAGRWRADLIVIGTHGRRGISRLLLGSVADGVVRTAATSVLLIRGAGRKAGRAR
jgi:nucleotide-binding universal stress UspA family protein